jgi:bis(5'-nucleosyl)-tetraphosphatase (symmetrical)
VSTWAIGDIQGCGETLRRLLERIGFATSGDRLWLVGDLVNRGPRSLDVLRWAREHEDRLVCVLGNHDLHLIGRAFGTRKPKKRDTLDDVLGAPERAELIDWLRRRPLLHREGAHVLVHAGLLPAWTLGEADDLARDLEASLRAPDPAGWLTEIFRGPTPRWTPELDRPDALRAALQALTRLRTCDGDGRVDDDYSGPPDGAAAGFRPWFDWPTRRDPEVTPIFGHWAALGLHLTPQLLGLDSGCVWGRALTAIRLEDRKLVQEPLAD